MKKLVLPWSILLIFSTGSIAQQNWDGDNPLGNFSYASNWFSDVLPAWSSAMDLTFQFSNNAAQTSMLHDLGWQPVRSIIYAGSFSRSIPLNDNGSSGLDFYWKIENGCPVQQIVNIPLSFKGTSMEINPVNGDLIFNKIIFNTTRQNINVYGNNNKQGHV
jgi:hypothetical protein